ncbi:MAG: hypothetical protein D6685_12715 [Bacteroidetes bacterium]|nr:MAG: hypothetical protein D6685_12715 [Bacteroidota bacterium]
MIAVRPPEYFPRLAYFALMMHVDRFVLADTFQYSRQSYQNRTRVRNPDGWQWMSIPLKGGQHDRPIRAVEIDQRTVWLKKHWRALEYNYRSSPYFEWYEPDLRPFFGRTWTHLAEATVASVELVCRLLGLDVSRVRASSLPGAPATTADVARAVGAGALLAPEDVVPVERHHVEDVVAFRYEEPTYRQNFAGFEPGQSVLDVLFNYGPEALAVIEQGLPRLHPS